MKLIALTKGQSAMVDDCDFERVVAFKWTASMAGKYYAVRVTARPECKRVYMHRFVVGAPMDRRFPYVDHINGDTLDNRRGNLRLATPAQNQANMNSRRGRNSTFKGVQYDGRYRKPWSIDVKDGSRRVRSRFATQIEAAKGYDIAALAIRGEFALLNFPRSDYCTLPPTPERP